VTEQTATEQLRRFKTEQAGKSAEQKKAAFGSQAFRELVRRAAGASDVREAAEVSSDVSCNSHCFSHCFGHTLPE